MFQDSFTAKTRICVCTNTNIFLIKNYLFLKFIIKEENHFPLHRGITKIDFIATLATPSVSSVLDF